MEISDGKLGALVFHLARSCPEALLQPARDGAGNITLSGRGKPTGVRLPVRARASRFICQWPGPVWYKLSHRWIYHRCLELQAYKLNTHLHFLYQLSTATSANSPQPLKLRVHSSRHVLFVSLLHFEASWGNLRKELQVSFGHVCKFLPYFRWLLMKY